MKQPILQAVDISKSFTRSGQQELLVLDQVNFNLYENEIVAILGKSGSGKSTLLRILSGLIDSSTGQVFYRSQQVAGPVKGISMVFQNFALMPWLTVLENVEIGLEALGVDKDSRRKRALGLIDTVGLDGFESAYPKELSGGMRQRVGLARALAVDPDVLLMDEPFSALDVLTAENLRSDLIDIWRQGKSHTKAILIVTHNIEEAVLMADRIIIFDSNPGMIKKVLAVDLSHPRDDEDTKFTALVDQVYLAMTADANATAVTGESASTISLAYRLPDADISEATGLLEELAEGDTNRTSLQALAESLHLDVDDLFTLTEILEILKFATISEGDIELTAAGRAFAKADILARKQIFAKHLLDNVSLARFIRQILDAQSDHCIVKDRIVDEIVDDLSEKEAERVLRLVIDWGRYAEIFAYDDNSRLLSLENPGEDID